MPDQSDIITTKQNISSQAQSARSDVERQAEEQRQIARQQRSELEAQAEELKAQARREEALERRKQDLPITRPQETGAKETIKTIEKVQSEAQAEQIQQLEAIAEAEVQAKQEISKLEAQAIKEVEAVEKANKKARLAFEKTHKQLSTGEWVDLDAYNSLDSADRQYLKKYGVDAFNKKLKTAQKETVIEVADDKTAKAIENLSPYISDGQITSSAILKAIENGRLADLETIGITGADVEKAEQWRNDQTAYEKQQSALSSLAKYELKKSPMSGLPYPDGQSRYNLTAAIWDGVSIKALKDAGYSDEAIKEAQKLAVDKPSYGYFKSLYYGAGIPKGDYMFNTYIDKWGYGTWVASAYTDFLTTIFPPAKVLKPEITLKDVKGSDWAWGIAGLWLLAGAPGLGKVVSTVANVTKTASAEIKAVTATAKTAGKAAEELKLAAVAAKSEKALLTAAQSSRLQIAQARSLSADVKFAETMSSLKSINPSQLAKVEKLADVKGLKQSVVDMNTALEKLNVAWAKARLYPVGSKRYINELVNVTKTQAARDSAYVSYQKVLTPRVKPTITPMKINELPKWQKSIIKQRQAVSDLYDEIRLQGKGKVSDFNKVFKKAEDMSPFDYPSAEVPQATFFDTASTELAKKTLIGMPDELLSYTDLRTGGFAKPLWAETAINKFSGGVKYPWTEEAAKTLKPGDYVMTKVIPTKPATGGVATTEPSTLTMTTEQVARLTGGQSFLSTFVVYRVLPGGLLMPVLAVSGGVVVKVGNASSYKSLSVIEATAKSLSGNEVKLISETGKIAETSPAISIMPAQQIQPAAKLQTQTAIATTLKTGVKGITATKAVTKIPSRTPLPKILPIIPLPDGKSRRMTLEEYLGSAGWKQGFMFKLIYPPYGRDNIVNTRKPIKGIPYYEGIGSAYKSIVKLGGELPEVIKRDMGIQDVIITTTGRTPVIKFRQDRKQKTKLTPRKSKEIRIAR